MASVTFDQFLPEIYPEVAGVPHPVAVNAVRNACFDFCRQSLIWNEFQDDETYTAEVAEYQVVAPADAQVVQILSIGLSDGRTLYPQSVDDIVAVRPQWRSHVGTIECYVQSSPDTLRFVSIPDAGGTYTVQAAYAPTRTASSVDDLLYNLYLESIKHGSLAKLKAMSGQPWSDPAGAAAHQQIFVQGISRAVTERTRGNSRASLRVANQWFA